MKKKERANPVFNTAKFTLYNLSKSGVEEAGRYLEALEFDEEDIAAFGMPGNLKSKMSVPNFIMQESRYCFINRIIDESGYTNIFDLACGFSPRGYRYSKSGYKYVGVDLPATVELVAPVAEKISESFSTSVTYCAADLTNPADVVNAAKVFDGEVCITAEGLLMYLDMAETEQFIKGIRAVLMEHGGCFVTPDYCTDSFLEEIVCSIYGQEEGRQLIVNTISALENTSDANVVTRKNRLAFIGKECRDAAKSFFEKYGLKVLCVPFYDYGTELGSLNEVAPETAERIKSGLNRTMAWVVTLDGNNEEENNISYTGNSGKSTMFVDKGVLKIKLYGRIDSISTPELFGMYDEISKNRQITGACIDMKDVGYISSAGLRFLLVLKKNIPGGDVKVENINPDVMNIFEMTGMSDFFLKS